MRDYLFRGKHKKGFWCYGNLVVKIDGASIITPDETPIGKYGAVIPETVGEYTGLTDKNGKKIFEGDIVTGYFNHEKIIGYIFYGTEASFFIRRDRLFGIGMNNAEDWLEVVAIYTTTQSFSQSFWRCDNGQTNIFYQTGNRILA
ncbi:MAG: YopX family protein [Candidatus Ornithomonoglobus sp.]